MIVAVFGSRQGYDLEHLSGWLDALWAKQGSTTLLVSGGADGVGSHAEAAWLAKGGRVKSYRPVKTAGGMQEDEYSIELWELGGERPMVFVLTAHPTWADYASACVYRDMLIAEQADRGVAFRANRSRGTTLTIGFFESLDKPVYVYEEVPHVTQ